jgi:tyrosyl-tRNA synthetase
MPSRSGKENDQSIGLHELLVPICQGLDSVELESEVEIGGQDQLFNFQVARVFARKARAGSHRPVSRVRSSGALTVGK